MPPESIPGWKSFVGPDDEPEQLELLPTAEVIVDDDEPTCDEPHCDDPTDEVGPLGFALGTLPTETPAPHRAHSTPTPAPDGEHLDAPKPRHTPPPALERSFQDLTVRPEPIRVQTSPVAVVVGQGSSDGRPGGGDDSHSVSERHPADRGVVTVTTPLVPDTQREAWVLDQVHGVLLEMRDHASWLQPLHSLVSDIRASAEEVRARTEASDRDANDRRTAELAAQLSRPPWRRVLDHRHAGRAFALATYLGGAATMAALDYLGLESEPLFRLLELVMGAQ